VLTVVGLDGDIEQLKRLAERLKNHSEKLDRVSRVDIHLQRNLAGAIGGEWKLMMLLLENVEAKLAVLKES
jgi:hypothetical protein